MYRRIVSILAVSASLFLALMLVAVLNIPLVSGSGTIYIKADGSVEPDTAPISSVDNITYTFTDNINDEIVVERDDIVVDGAGHTVQGPGSGTGIDLSRRKNVTIKNMEIKAFDYGIKLYYSSNNNIIFGNNITENDYYGVRLFEASNNNIIFGNNITENENSGISLYGSSNDNSISGNQIINNYAGIGFDGSSNNTVFGNNITNNSRWGIVLFKFSNNNTVFGNNITNNSQYGIRLIESSNNSIYHNNFINNTDQVYTYNSVNVWDDDYLSGGNYWSDYTGIDLYSGPYQNETGSDGIGDTPYVIDANNQDRYPLMPPFEDVTPPTTTDNYDGLWHTTDFVINLTATDNLTGVAETYYQINDDPIQNVSAHAQPFITAERANNTLEYWSVDNAGNEEIPHKILTDIKLDKTAPSGYILINNEEAYTTTLNVTLSLWASDATSGVSQMRLSNDGTNWTAWETYATSKAWNLSLGEGTKTVYTQYKDIAGLVSSTYNDTILLDVNSPTTTVSLSAIEGDNGWFTSNVTVTLSAIDNISGVEKTEYSFDNTTWTIYTTPFNITNEGNTIIYYKSTDNAGNTETIKTETIKIDKTTPSGSIIINNGDAYTTSPSATLNLTATDATSGIVEMRFSNDNITYTEWQTYTTSTPWTLQNGDDGTKTVYVQFKDHAGLISTYSDTIILDIIPPTGSIIIAEGATYTNSTLVTLTLSADDMTSGVSQMRFSHNNITWMPWEDYAVSKAWDLPTGDGEKTVYVQFKDNAGLISQSYADAIILDTTPPSGSISIAEGSAYTNTTQVTLTLTATDATSGVAEMRFSNDDATWSDWEAYATSKSWTLLTGDGIRAVTVQYRDNAGLISFYSDAIILDTTKPAANAGTDQTVAEDMLVTFDGSASTDENGIASYTWTFTDATPQTLSGKNPTHTFAAIGRYTVTLKVTDPAGNSATDTVIITVLDITKPIANAGADRTVNEDISITLDGSASTDNVGITTYTWTFTDVTAKTLTGEKPAYTFNTPGVYTITLNVTDADGNWATDAVVITVLDVTNPIANAGQNQTVHVGETVTFDADASSDNMGIISYEWNFGDETTGTGITTTHTYAEPGTYTVTLTVKDEANNIHTHSITITVLPTESFNLWIVGAIAAVLIGIALTITLFWRRRRKQAALP